MKNLILIVSIFCAMNANAQNYLISFSGTGESSTVSTVKVENLISGTSLTLDGSDILSLSISTGLNSDDYKASSWLKVYPNPMNDNTLLQFYPPEEGNAVITVFDFTGKPVAQSQSYLEKSGQEFRLSGVGKGLYLINVRGNNYQFSGRLISNGKSNGTISIAKVNNIVQATDGKAVEKESKGIQSTIDMAYTTGDRLKFTGISGIYSTVITDIPVSDKTITFNFMTCIDGDNNNYPVVKIGTQVWMAENLNTTKYNDGTVIPNITDNTAWAALATGAYCDYSNTPSYSTTYGRLYNWYAIDNNLSTKEASNGGKNVCPTSWHIPNDAEWTILTDYLGGLGIGGGKLKETGIIHWKTPNAGATNETGFTALAGGLRLRSGTFNFISIQIPFWSSTDYLSYPYQRTINYSSAVISRVNSDMGNGFPVRCLKDN